MRIVDDRSGDIENLLQRLKENFQQNSLGLIFITKPNVRLLSRKLLRTIWAFLGVEFQKSAGFQKLTKWNLFMW